MLFRAPIRSVHTRVKKVTVQATQDFGRRYTGEVFDVAEGHMRLVLHPARRAVYVLKDRPLPLPELPKSEAQKRRQEVAQRLKMQKQELTQEKPTPEQQAVNKILESLSFPTAGERTSPATAATPTDGTPTNSTNTTANATPSSTDKRFAWQSAFVADLTKK